MNKIEFNNACYEVLEILKYVKKEDLLKIPQEEIQMLERNANLNCNFKYDPQRSIKEQNVSKLAKGIIAVYFSKYVASPKQREKIILKQKNDLKIIEYEKKEKYNVDNLFKIVTKTNIENEENVNMQLIEYKKDKWYKKIFRKILKIFKRM